MSSRSAKHLHPILQLENVSLKLDDRMILSDITFTLHAGEFVTIIGPNGAGKTTLLKIILGLLSPTTGKISRQTNLKIGYTPQKLTSNFMLPLQVQKFLALSQRPEKDIKEVLALVKASHLRDHSIHVLSGGEFQRVLLARALLQNPDILVLDEPLQGIDVNGQTDIYRLLMTIKHHLKCSIVLVSHDLHFVHAASDQVICLNHHICCAGHPIEVQKNPEYLKLFTQTLPPDLAFYQHHHDHSHDTSS